MVSLFILEMKESIWMTRECWWENRTLHENPHPVDMQERIFKAFLWLSVRKEVKKAWPLQIPRSISHLPICPLPSTCTNSWPLHVFVFLSFEPWPQYFYLNKEKREPFLALLLLNMASHWQAVRYAKNISIDFILKVDRRRLLWSFDNFNNFSWRPARMILTSSLGGSFSKVLPIPCPSLRYPAAHRTLLTG